MSDHPKIEQLIKGIPAIPVKPSESVCHVIESKREDRFGVPCTRETTENTVTQELESIVSFSPNISVLWPGAVIQGNSLESGLLVPITLKRAPATITVTNLQFEDSHALYHKQIENPAHPTVETAIHELLSQPVKGVQAARIQFFKREAYSLEQGMLAVSLSARWLTNSVKAQLEQNIKKERSNYIVRFVQPYYDISFQEPAHPTEVFQPDIKYDDVTSQMAVGNPPVYVSTITYGRMLLFIISASASAEDLRSTIDATFNSGAFSGGLNLTLAQKQIITESEINVLALGGGPGDAVSAIVGDKLTGIIDYLKAGANFSAASPGFPISYVVRYLKDNTVARLSYTTNFRADTYPPLPVIRKLNVNFHTHGDDKDREEAVEMWFRNMPWKLEYATAGWLRFPRYVEQGKEVGHGRWGAGERWEDHSDRTYDVTLEEPIPVDDISNLYFRLRKHPNEDSGCGWRMSISIRAIVSDGRSATVYEWPEKLVGDGNQYDFYNNRLSHL